MAKLLRYMNKRLVSPPFFRKVKAYATTSDEPAFEKKALWNVLPYSNYAYIIFHGCRIASLLGLKRVSVVEFGVAGGNGLVAMEQHSEAVTAITGVEIDVYGFDTGKGLPPPEDYRDMPYMFAAGNYQMNVQKLKSRLRKAKLVLGEVKETTNAFLKEYEPAPIAAVSFDLDYYSSTMAALSLFQGGADDRFFLPRIMLSFDNTVGNQIKMYNEFTGELLAISDFNDANRHIKIAADRSFRNYNFSLAWYNKIFVMHRFHHALYGKYISSHTPKTLKLRD